MKETIPESLFKEMLWSAVTLEQLLAMDGLQRYVIETYDVQLEIAYE